MAFDLRSDTVTLPSEGMRQAMASAEVGDMYYGEDPTVLKLEAFVREMFGFESAVFMPSGTMSNQIAVRLHCRPGESVLAHSKVHLAQFESGALGAMNGVQIQEPALLDGFMVDPSRLAESVTQDSQTYASVTKLVSVEQTHLWSGGRVQPISHLEHLSETSKKLGLVLHCDGARIWHAHSIQETNWKRYGALFDSLSVCFSKGLGAPVGSCLLTSQKHHAITLRYRKMFGGTMRQAGILAAGALYALEKHLPFLNQDHEKAKHFAKFLSHLEPRLHCPTPETNIVMVFANNETTHLLQTLLETLKMQYQVVMTPFTPSSLRAVFHRDIDFDLLKQTCRLD